MPSPLIENGPVMRSCVFTSTGCTAPSARRSRFSKLTWFVLPPPEAESRRHHGQRVRRRARSGVDPNHARDIGDAEPVADAERIPGAHNVLVAQLRGDDLHHVVLRPFGLPAERRMI